MAVMDQDLQCCGSFDHSVCCFTSKPLQIGAYQSRMTDRREASVGSISLKIKKIKITTH